MNRMLRAICGLVALVATAQSAPAQQFTMKISSPTVNDVMQEWARLFTAGVKARAGDKIKVEFYPANQLGQIPATVEGLAMGTIEVVGPASGFFIGLEPRFQVFDAPGLFKDHGSRRSACSPIRRCASNSPRSAAPRASNRWQSCRMAR